MMRWLAVATFTLMIGTSALGMAPGPLPPIREPDHAGRGRLRSGQNADQRRLRCKDDDPPNPARCAQVSPLAGEVSVRCTNRRRETRRSDRIRTPITRF